MSLMSLRKFKTISFLLFIISFSASTSFLHREIFLSRASYFICCVSFSNLSLKAVSIYFHAASSSIHFCLSCISISLIFRLLVFSKYSDDSFEDSCCSFIICDCSASHSDNSTTLNESIFMPQLLAISLK